MRTHSISPCECQAGSHQSAMDSTTSMASGSYQSEMAVSDTVTATIRLGEQSSPVNSEQLRLSIFTQIEAQPNRVQFELNS
jgi:hypothetical protein